MFRTRSGLVTAILQRFMTTHLLSQLRTNYTVQVTICLARETSVIGDLSPSDLPPQFSPWSPNVCLK